MTKENILSEIKRLADSLGKAPGKEKFSKETGIQFSDWYGRYWARWSDALAEAGLNSNQFNQAYSDEFVISKMIDLTRELGRYPVNGELKIKAKLDPDFPSHSVFSRVGNKNTFLQKLINYCMEREGYDDILQTCSPLLKSPENQSVTINRKGEEYSFVYLFKSGKYYKIGRSNSSGRREYEVGLKLPEPLQKLHEIRTDDPVGIESYWHNRFRAKRKNGEWFELSSDEVNIFKKRKFM